MKKSRRERGLWILLLWQGGRQLNRQWIERALWLWFQRRPASSKKSLLPRVRWWARGLLEITGRKQQVSLSSKLSHTRMTCWPHTKASLAEDHGRNNVTPPRGGNSSSMEKHRHSPEPWQAHTYLMHAHLPLLLLLCLNTYTVRNSLCRVTRRRD